MGTNAHIEFRRAGAADARALADLIRRGFADVARRFHLTPQNCPKHPSNYSEDWVAADLRRSVAYTLAACGETLVGCVGLEVPQAGLCYLERLAVLPEHRRQGLGQRLVAGAIDRARKRGCLTMSIGIIAAQVDLKAWYCKLGFVPGETKQFAHLPFDVLFMSRRLAPSP